MLPVHSDRVSEDRVFFWSYEYLQQVTPRDSEVHNSAASGMPSASA